MVNQYYLSCLPNFATTILHISRLVLLYQRIIFTIIMIGSQYIKNLCNTAKQFIKKIMKRLSTFLLKNFLTAAHVFMHQQLNCLG